MKIHVSTMDFHGAILENQWGFVCQEVIQYFYRLYPGMFANSLAVTSRVFESRHGDLLLLVVLIIKDLSFREHGFWSACFTSYR